MNSKSIIRGYRYARKYYEDTEKLFDPVNMPADFKKGCEMFENDLKSGNININSKRKGGKQIEANYNKRVSS